MAGVISGLVNDQSLPVSIEPARWRTDWGFTNLRLQAVEYNVTTSFYDPISKSRRPALNQKLILCYGSGGAGGLSIAPSIADMSQATSYTFGTSALTGMLDIVDIPDENGTITINGVKPYTSGVASAFVFDALTGDIEWATDWGIFSGKAGGAAVRVTTENFSKLVLIFQCGSIVAFNIFNPVNLTPISGAASVTFGATQITGVAIQSYLSHAQLISWSLGGFHYADVMAFVPPDEPIELLIYAGYRFPYGILINSSSQFPKGSGYKVNSGQTLRILATPHEVARQTYALNKDRVNTALGFGSSDPTILLYDDLSLKYLNMSDSFIEKNQYGKLYGLAYASWSYLVGSYQAMMSLLIQIIATVVVFSLMMVLLALISERLLFEYHGSRRVIAILTLFAVYLSVLAFFHPGFWVATNSLITILSVSVLVVIFPILFFITSEIQSSGRIIKESTMGIHGAEVSRSSTLATSLSVAIQYMKKRWFRSILSIISISLIVFALISFTSISFAPFPRYEVVSSEHIQINYKGVLIRQYPWRQIPSELYL
ncbi:MAG: hypothetical protein QXU67_03880, partial [Candidatus Bathyarchaeia archaeon]